MRTGKAAESLESGGEVEETRRREKSEEGETYREEVKMEMNEVVET